MKVLMVGSGGREHAILATLKRTSATPLRLYCAPGNAGITGVAECKPIAVNDREALVQLAKARVCGALQFSLLRCKRVDVLRQCIA